MVPEGDAAAETARDAGAEIVAAPAFEPVGAEAREAAVALASDADAAIAVGGGAGGDGTRVEGDRADPNAAVLAAADRAIEIDRDVDDADLLDAVRDPGGDLDST